MAIGQAEADEYVTRLVIKRASRKDIRDLFAEDDAPAQRAKDEAAALQAKLDEATESFYKLTGGISAEKLAEIEQRLKPLIADATRRSLSSKAPQAMLDLMEAGRFGEEKVRPVWEGLPIPAQRETLKLIFDEIHLDKTVDRLTRWSTAEQRLAAAHQRMSVEFRTAIRPTGDRARAKASAGSATGGAREQRRRQTLIELGVPTADQPLTVPVPAPRSRSRAGRSSKVSAQQA